MEEATENESGMDQYSQVLVVDDEESLRGVVSEVLTDEGFRVAEAASAEEALSILENEYYPLVITDIRLGGTTGIQLLKEIKQLYSDTEVVVMTAHATLETSLTALRLGAYDYLLKPFEDLQLISSVAQRAFRIIRLNRENRELLETLKDKNQELLDTNNTIKEIALRDPLTNLYNRRSFPARIRAEIVKAEKNGESLAFLLCDLDRFKALNDTKGHDAGDELLKLVAKDIQEATRGSDLAFRWGGDEFIVALRNSSRSGVLLAASRIRKSVQKNTEDPSLGVDISIGVSFYPEHGEKIEALVRMADQALYIAKKSGSHIHIGQEEYLIDESSIHIVFQPVMDVNTKKVLGYEALSRDPKGKLDIKKLFKKYQVIGQLDLLKILCFKLQLKTAQTHGIKRLFLNVDFGLLEQVGVIKKPSDMEVILEISESEDLSEFDKLLRISEQWREEGYQFAMDDFGSGFVSFPFMASLVPDYIKIDRSTILLAVSSERFRAFSKDLVKALEHYSKKGIIAEGVETEEELGVTKDLGIHLVQGFLLGSPETMQ